MAKGRKVNPVIQKAREEGYNAGFMAGVKQGFEQGKYSACMHFANRFDGIEKVKGIGPKTMKLIIEHFGAELFDKEEGVKGD